ncbi:hypothetical protein BN946_scf184884.g7 [Trametes cinnabarina]|uniref:Uncharacterized protein n=1 Tax=Pycnoporus cinnabarinus TaxID=5643 RepID=A0A060SBV4_PYCCI|nr:hypothetical protein BN946_scf184884.g7 [Trametes cinnabarina]
MSRKAGTSDDANDLLHIHTYFKSPVNTLVASLQQTSEDITVHDLLDAYSTICLRVSTVEHALLPPNDAPALQYVRSNSLSLGRCMQRDIRLALLDPLRVAKTESLASVSWPAIGISEEQFCAARITAMLCHSALNLVSAIFRSAAMHRLFSHNVLQHLLDDVLVVAQSSELPTVDDVKTRSLASWVLSTLQLPEEVVRASRSPIMEILNDAAEDMGSHLRACDIIHNIISTYPRIFLMDSAQFLPDILKRLNATTATVRMDATVALAGFALGVLSTSSMMAVSELPEIQAAVHKFIRSQMPSSHAAPISSTSTSTLLPDYIANAAKGDLTDHSAYGPRWAIVVVCCLIVLSGKAIFTGQRALRLVLTTMERVAKRRDATGLNLVACAWKCLIWVFLQLPPNRPPESTGPDRRSPTTKDVAFGIIKQDLRGGTGACLIAGLLYSADNPDSSIGEMCRGSHLDWAVDVLREMVTYPSVTVYRDSLVVLERLLSGIGTSPEDSEALPQGSRWNPNHLVVKTLFARHVLRAAHQDFLEALHAANQFEPAWVRPLGETEILKRWEDLADIWTSSVRRQLQMLHTTFSLPEALIHAWQALLLVQTQLTQEKEHLTTSPDLTSRTVSIISDFLSWIPGPVVPFNAALSADEAQYRVLTLCHQLWMVMRNVFSDYWLLTVAESILASVLRRTFDLSDERVRNAWSQFCAALVSVSAPKLIATLVVEDEQSRVIDVKRELWRMMANGWPSRIPKPTPEDAVEFLAIPMRCWYMEQREIDAWISIFDDVLSHSSYSSSPASPIFDTIADNINGATLEKFVNTPAIVLHMLDHLRLSDDSGHPLKFLRCIDDLLCILYSDLPENVSLALQILGHVRRIVSECPTRALVTVLATLSKGVATWVGDERERLLNAEYNEVVIPIYCDALHALKTVSVTPDDLTSLASLLYSAFIRMPDPGHGPVAFYEFWVHIYPSLQGMRGAYPEQIKVALQACRPGPTFTASG